MAGVLIPSNEKQAFIALVQAAPGPLGGPFEASRLQDILVYYSDIYTAIMRELDLFASNNAYLTQGLACFDDTELLAVGIWNNKTVSSPPISDPILVVNSTYTDDLILISAQPSPPINQTLCILGASNIFGVSLEADAVLSELYIGPGVIVDSADASQPGALIRTIWLPYLKSTPSTLISAVYGSQIQQFIIDDGSYFGGYTLVLPAATCQSTISNITASEATNNSLFISWTPPADPYLFINTFYRKTNSMPWIPVTDADGDFVNESGFIFRHLEKDTYYDFKVAVTCNNGVVNNTIVSAQTICCGAGTSVQLYKVCPVTFIISITEDSPPNGQVLCNGTSIALNYPPGTTITVPYFASVNAVPLNDFIVDNVPYQLMPYNKSTGTWDASATPLTTFIAGNVITVDVSLPV